MPTAKDLLTAPLKRAGVPDADALVLEQLALLRGNHLLDEGGPRRPTKTKPAAPIRRDCAEHPGTETPGGRCPHGCPPKGE